MRDYLEQILERLDGELDPRVFERCMGDLLRPLLPGLVPVLGGADSGFDGAFPDGEGCPIPLACTTARGFAAIKVNLVKSIRSAKERSSFRGKIAFATSQPLTPREKVKLEEAAGVEGATLWNKPFDREVIADLLYRDQHWCEELLHLSGRPRALSVRPVGSRPYRDTPLIGREADLEWLRATRGDRVVHGQPGSGKTFLLCKLAEEGEALFVIDDDSTQVANDLREVGPAAVIVDDAHVHVGRIDLLRQLRADTRQSFDIIATCWPGEGDAVAHRLGISSRSQIRALELLTRNQIVELYRQLGIEGPPQILRHLVTMASNKPGLAATLAESWLAGDQRDVLTGEALRRDVVETFRPRVTPDTGELLAAFSLGGDGGMSIEAVAGHLGAQIRGIKREAADLSAGGVLREVTRGTLAVTPDVLRWALVAHTFFPRDDSLSQPYRDLLEAAPRAAVALEVIGAAGVGGVVPRELLRDLVLRAEEQTPWLATRAWRALGRVDADQAVWVLDHYPREVGDVARDTLELVPEQTLRRLLTAAEAASGPLHSQPSHPLRIVSDWIRAIGAASSSRTDEPLRRRQQLVRCARCYVDAGGSREIALQAMLLALDPSLEGHERDPGKGDTITLRWGLLDSPSLERFSDIWAEVRLHFNEVTEVTWPHLSHALWSWIHPDSIGPIHVSDEARTVLQDLAREVLRDLAPRTAGRPGLAARLRDFAGNLGVELGKPADPVFEVLFPEREIAASSVSPDRLARVKSIAASWAARSPTDVGDEVARYAREERLLAPGHENLLPELCREIASRVNVAADWLDRLLLERDASPWLVGPLVERAVVDRSPEVEELLGRCLESPSLWWIGVESALRADGLSEGLFDRAIREARRMPESVETLCSRGNVPLSTLRKLLGGDEGAVRVAAAVGEWHRSPAHEIRAEVREEWREALLRVDANVLRGLSSGLEFWLGEIMRSDPTVAFEWLLRLLPEAADQYVKLDGPTGRALASIDGSQRGALLPVLRDGAGTMLLLPRLVERDEEVYGKLLELPHLRGLHLEPLQGVPDESWDRLACRALKAGYGAQDVAKAAFLGMHSIEGDGESYWQAYEAAFARIRVRSPAELRDVAEEGEQMAIANLDSARSRRRRHGLEGF